MLRLWGLAAMKGKRGTAQQIEKYHSCWEPQARLGAQCLWGWGRMGISGPQPCQGMAPSTAPIGTDGAGSPASQSQVGSDPQPFTPRARHRFPGQVPPSPRSLPYSILSPYSKHHYGEAKEHLHSKKPPSTHGGYGSDSQVSPRYNNQRATFWEYEE